jgi:hypothetical protein
MTTMLRMGKNIYINFLFYRTQISHPTGISGANCHDDVIYVNLFISPPEAISTFLPALPDVLTLSFEENVSQTITDALRNVRRLVRQSITS